MKTHFFCIILLISISNILGQVGIGNTNPQSVLDIAASNPSNPSNEDGLLIPRIDAFPSTDPGMNQNSMIVYLTTTDGSSTPGFYYWDSSATSWRALGSGSGDAWELSGNTGTINGTDFIGTTDAQALDIRTDDVIRARFTTGGQLEILNAGGSILIGEGTGTADDLTDNENVFIGKDVAPNVSTGSSTTFDSDDNIGIAREALNALTTGTNNVALGRQALETITTNEDNIALGSAALQDLAAGGIGNIAIGSGASANRTGGSENTIVGYSAELFRVATGNSNSGFGGRTLQRLTNGNANTAIGHNAGSILEDGSYNTLIGRMAASGNTGGEVDPDMKASVIIGDQAGGIAHFNNLFVLDNSIGTTPLLSGVFANDSAFGGGGIKDQGPYDDNRLGINIDYSGAGVNLTHTLTVGGNAKIEDVLNLKPKASEPAVLTSDEGDIYYDSTLDELRSFDGTMWSTIGSANTDTQDLSIDNTTATLSLVDGGDVVVSTIADEDADTKIQVEEGVNEDIIRLDIAGTETVTFQGSRINTVNAGSSTFLGDGAGAADDLSNNRTTFIGYQAGGTVTTGIWNTAIGYQALNGNTTGGSNTMIGYQAGFNTTTSDNVGIGRWTLRNNAANGSGDGRNVAVGTGNSAYTNGAKNVAIGNGAMGVTNSGSQFLESNVSVGSGAGFFLRDAIGNVALGANAGDFLENGDYNVIIGYDAGRRINNGSTNNIMIGREVGGNSNMVSDKRTFMNSILIGHNAGFLEDQGSEDRLYIEHSGSRTPLIGGDFANDRVGINIDMTTTTPTVGDAPDALTHTLTVGGSVKINTLMNLNPSTAPAAPDRGDVYYDNATNKVRVWTGSAWENLN